MRRTLFDTYLKELEHLDLRRYCGKVLRLAGGVIESAGPAAEIGDLCTVSCRDGAIQKTAEVIGFRGETLVLMPLEEISEIGPGAIVEKQRAAASVPVGEGLLGRVLNAHGEAIDRKGPLAPESRWPLLNFAPDPLKRRPVNEPLYTGVRAIDGFLTIGRGQRLGIIAGSGVGKSILLGMIARNSDADINVIALIGERGREVLEFLERDLGPQGREKSIVVVATSDEMPLLRRRGALLATTIAEYFRESGHNVMFMMDSLTRVAMAQREIGLAAGEPPTTRGYTPSTFSFLPRLVERTGNIDAGSITGIYTVLVESDDINDPVGDTARGTLDGHIILSRALAERAHYPAIDVLQSASRVMPGVVSQEHFAAARKLRELLAIYQEAEDLINIGAYHDGANARIDAAKAKIEHIRSFLQQDMTEYAAFPRTLETLRALAEEPANKEEEAK